MLDYGGGWPDGVWRLDVGPHALTWRGLMDHTDDEPLTPNPPQKSVL